MNKKQSDFALANEPVDFQISVHVQNLMATYGEKKVQKALKELFGVNNKGAKRVRKTG